MNNETKTSLILVDDNDETRAALRDFLKTRNYDVKDFPNGKETVYEIKTAQEKYDFAFVDHVLTSVDSLIEDPDALDGIETVKQIREHNSDIGIVVFSGNPQVDERDRFNAILAGADGYVYREGAVKTIDTINGFVRQIRELRELEKELTNIKEGKLPSLVVGLGVGISVVDRAYRIRYMNELQSKMTSTPERPAKVGGICWREYHWEAEEEDQIEPCEDCPVRRLFETGTMQVSLIKAIVAGREGSHVVIATPLFDSEGNIIAAVESVYETTEDEIIKDMLSEIAGMFNPNDMATHVVEMVAKMGYDRVRLYFVSADGQHLTAKAGYGMADVPGFIGIRLPRVEHALTELSFQQRRSIIRKLEPGEVDPNAEELAKKDVLQWLEVPLKVEDRFIGKLSIDNKYSRKDFTKEDRLNMDRHAELIARAIVRAVEHEEIVLRSQMLEGLRAIDDKINEGTNIFRDIVSAAIEILAANSVTVRVAQRAGLVLTNGKGTYFEVASQLLQLSNLNHPSAKTFTTGDSEIIHNAIKHRNFSVFIESFKDEGIKKQLKEVRSFGSFLISFGDEKIGTLSLQSTSHDFFTREKIELVECLARRLAFSVHIERQARATAWKGFSSRAAHRMGTRLADFAGALDLLPKSLASGNYQKTQKYLEQMETAAYGMEAIIDQFRVFVTPREINFGCLNINELIQELSDTIRRSKEKVKLQLKLQDDLPQINADKNALFDVFRELITNATNAQEKQMDVKEKAKIEIRTTCFFTVDEACREVQIEVANPSQGIPPENKGKIFEPFFTTRARGSGLGLAIAKEIIEEHGGGIEEVGEYGKEARFIIRLPIPNQKELKEQLENSLKEVHKNVKI